MKGSPEDALAEAFVFLRGLNVEDPDLAADYIVEQLAFKGYSVQPLSVPVLHDMESATLGRVRSALGLTIGRLAKEADLNRATVSRAESPERKTLASTRQIIADALIRLGARRPD